VPHPDAHEHKWRCAACAKYRHTRVKSPPSAGTLSAAVPHEEQESEHNKNGAMLLHKKASPKQKPGREKQCNALLSDSLKQEEDAEQRKNEDKMFGVRSQSEDRGTERHSGERDGCRDADLRIIKPFSNKVDGKGTQQVYQQKAEMDTRGRLPETGKNGRVGKVDTRHLHVVGLRKRRNALQDQLAGIGVFSFVAFERDGEKMDAEDGCDSQENEEKEQGRPVFEKCPFHDAGRASLSGSKEVKEL